MSLISPLYLDSLFTERDELGLAWLSAAICGAPNFDHRQVIYGLPAELFLFVEDLLWFSQSVRSGAWTYFEATPEPRKQALLDALATDGPSGWAERYAFGLGHWRDPELLKPLDKWIDDHDRENTQFLWGYLSRHRQLVDQLLA